MNTERIQVADIRDGDTIFIHYENFLTKDQRGHMVEWFKDKFPKNEVVILDGGLQLSVARPGSNELMERITLATEKLAEQFSRVSGGGHAVLTETSNG